MPPLIKALEELPDGFRAGVVSIVDNTALAERLSPFEYVGQPKFIIFESGKMYQFKFPYNAF